jgi:hypothetical protein
VTTGAILILITQVITLVTAGLSFWASRRNKAAIQEVHVSINSRMDQLIAQTAKASHAEGMADEKANSTS